ncbi:MAG TPA: hypothetical protein VHV10_18615 [Ktedonobacteraceae bacterium]|nr:hypothetical protein [Ktedonobacteraceae bacterium]
MPFAFLIVGTVLVVSGVRGQSQTLFSLVRGDFTGQNNYIYWMFSILLIGALGYIQSLKTFSHAFLALILIVLVLKEGSDKNPGGGFFQQFNSALREIAQGNSTNGAMVK